MSDIRTTLLENVLSAKAFDSLAYNDTSVYAGNNRETYTPLEEEGPRGELILERESDGTKFLVEWTVTVREYDD